MEKLVLSVLIGLLLLAFFSGCASQEPEGKRAFRKNPPKGFDGNFERGPSEGFDRNFQGRPEGFDEDSMFARIAEQLGLPEGAGKTGVLEALGLPEDASMEEIRNAMKERNIGFYGNN